LLLAVAVVVVQVTDLATPIMQHGVVVVVVVA
jgi:hypothetical protein